MHRPSGSCASAFVHTNTRTHSHTHSHAKVGRECHLCMHRSTTTSTTTTTPSTSSTFVLQRIYMKTCAECASTTECAVTECLDSIFGMLRTAHQGWIEMQAEPPPPTTTTFNVILIEKCRVSGSICVYYLVCELPHASRRLIASL